MYLDIGSIKKYFDDEMQYCMDISSNKEKLSHYLNFFESQLLL